MKRTPTFLMALALSAFALTWSSSAFAQDPSSTQQPDAQDEPGAMQPAPNQAPPKPAGRSSSNIGDNADVVDDSGVTLRPDDSSLTGVQVAGLGTQLERHSYIVPGIQYGNFFRSSTLEAPEVGDWNSTSFVAGNVSILQQWSRAQFAMNYTGGGTFATDAKQGNGYYHQMQAQQMFEWRHAKLSINDQIGSIGYDYQLTKRDTLGILYRFTGYSYIGDPQRIGDHVAQLAYGRKITGRAALQLFVGPEITEFKVPLNNQTQRVSISGGGNLAYAVSHTNFTIGYNHGVAAGSGAFAGSTADQITGSATRHLNRIWDANFNMGYARNRSLGGFVGTLNEPEVNSYFFGAGVQRPLGRTATASFAYTAFIENSFAGCSTGACIGYLQHQLSVSFQWHAQPLVIE